MKRRAWFLIPLLPAAVALVFLVRSSGEAMVRRHFTPIAGAERPEGVDEEVLSEMGEDLSDPRVYRFRDTLRLGCGPGRRGKQGVFFTFRVRSLDGQPVRTAVGLRRRGKITWLKRYRRKRMHHSFSREMQFLKGDEVVIHARGDGLIAVNPLLMYDRVEKEDRRYVFVIALDTLRYDRLGGRRGDVPLTPHIDRLRRESCDFSRAYAQSNWTLPSFMSFFTALYEYHHQITRFTRLDRDKPFLVESLARNAFTVNFNAGLWLQGKFGFSRGFDYFSVYSSPKDSRGGEKLFAKTTDFLRRHHPPSLFMFLHTYQIHSPFSPPPEFLHRINPAPQHTDLDSFFYRKQYRTDISEGLREAMEELYDAEILAFDDFFGRFIGELRQMGIYDQSLIVFLSDHGEEFFEHGGWAHCHSLFEEVIHVPLFVKFPGGRHAGKTIGTEVGLIDVLPTLLDVAGIPLPEDVDGESLLPLLDGGSLDRSHLLSSTTVAWLVKQIPPRLAILDGSRKIISRTPFSDEDRVFFSEFGGPPELGPLEVYDLDRDPLERRPLAGVERDRSLAGIMREVNRLRRFVQDIMRQTRRPTVKMSAEDERKLRSLGYL